MLLLGLFSSSHSMSSRGMREYAHPCCEIAMRLNTPAAARPAIHRPSRISSQSRSSMHARLKNMKYPVALIRTEEGYSVSCPGLPGCWSQGATEEEALANIRDAIHDYLEVAKELAGERILREVEVSA